jgi:energy-coupling factor transporter ATP-binding protein EcfA2
VGPDHTSGDASAKLIIRNLNFHYGNFQALQNISLDVRENCVTALIGPSGCGKSSLLRTLNRMNETVPDTRLEGEILLDSESIFPMEVFAVRRRVGMVFQKAVPFPKSIFDNVAFGLRVNGNLKRPALSDAVEWSLRRAALWNEVKDRLNRSAYELSGGQQQRLCIARALAVNPEVLLRRAVLGHRSNRHREDRRIDSNAERQLHDRHGDPQYASSPACGRLHRIFSPRASDRVRYYRGDLREPLQEGDPGLHLHAISIPAGCRGEDRSLATDIRQYGDVACKDRSLALREFLVTA